MNLIIAFTAVLTYCQKKLSNMFFRVTTQIALKEDDL